MTKITGLDARIIQIEENQRLLIQGFQDLPMLKKRISELEVQTLVDATRLNDADELIDGLIRQLDELHGDVDALSADE